MNAMKRTLAALVVSGGAALALTPVAAHADAAPAQAPPVVGRVVDIVDHPHRTVQDAKTAVAVTTSAAGTASGAADTSLKAPLDSLPETPAVK
ncbi:hypothetical protein PV721_09735 [Streptomyces sp. MB09-01]|uniref:hypothetical protein n=1 Tax=Streptomyces sp. MB09-01 TaxID=3028666 RepID=UPI0029A86257|nr:hypothetical protein [Streptomyces sp. MB09-01]MDX3534645.1 hypothetical protein [Streptomyces sp. MB09-01]